MSDIGSLVLDVDSSQIVEATKNIKAMTEAVENLKATLNKFKPEKTVISVKTGDWLADIAGPIIDEIYRQ